MAAAVIGPRLQRDREIDAPNNVAMVAVGAGLLWLGWNGFNGGDPYASNMSAAAAVLNTNLCTAVALLVWIAWDYLTGRKPSLIGTVNGMIVGLVAITPAAGYVNGWGAIAIGIIASTIVYFALNYLSRLRPFRNVDDTLGVIYTHGFAGLAGGLLVGVFADPQMALFYKTSKHGLIASGGVAGLVHGNWTLLKWQFFAALFVICLDGGDHVHPAQAGRAVHPAADVRDRTWRSATSPSTATRCTRPTSRRSGTPTGSRASSRRGARTRHTNDRMRTVGHRAGRRAERLPAHAPGDRLAGRRRR